MRTATFRPARGSLRVALAMAAALVLVDQASKWLALAFLPGQSIHVGPGWLRLSLELHLNPGAFLGMGALVDPALRSIALQILVAVAVGAMLVWSLRHFGSHPLAPAVGLLAVGGACNVFDRWIHAGRVVDFLVLGAGPLHTGVFNVADVAITAGVLWLLVDGVIGKHPEKVDSVG